jgi:alpha-tubulin suppressor-like RCC1 family protein
LLWACAIDDRSFEVSGGGQPVEVTPNPFREMPSEPSEMAAASSSGQPSIRGPAAPAAEDTPAPAQAGSEPSSPGVTACSRDEFLQDGSCHLQAVSLSVGQDHVCVVLRDETVRCLGNNSEGQLGNGTRESSLVPVTVTGLNDVLRISAGSQSTCALRRDGVVSCWGRGVAGAGVVDPLAGAATPTIIEGLEAASDVAAGSGYACALLLTFGVSCWGVNTYGQLGNGTTIFSAAPVTVELSGQVFALSVGTNSTCVLIEGRVECWGELLSPTPADVGFSDDNLSVTTSAGMFCARNDTQRLTCFGAGMSYLDPTIDSSGTLVPTRLSAFRAAKDVALSSVQVCVLESSTSNVSCAGFNYENGLGDPSVSEDSFTPLTVVGLEGVAEISGQAGNWCALRWDGSVWCWGRLDLFGAQLASTRAAPLPAW